MRLAEGEDGEREVARFVMEAYLAALTRYARRLPDLGPLDPEDIVHDFLSVKVAAPGFFERWLDSGRPLRRWLVNGFHFRMKDRRRQALSERRRTESTMPELEEVDETRFARFEGDWARDLVRRAVETSADECRARGLERHWRVFERHHLDGRPFRELVVEFEEPPRRLARMSRTAADRLRIRIHELLQRDGVPPSELATEISRLLELVSR